jgi:acyl-CoA reductase-like NAD-dependent aldehyde dehydrogenase
MDKTQIERIVSLVWSEMNQNAAPAQAPTTQEWDLGVYDEIEAAIQAALRAQAVLVGLPLAQREKLIQIIREVGLTHRREYGELELAEAELGAVEGTMLKIEVACQAPGLEDLAPEVFSGDRGTTLLERIPVGVIASVNAITNAAPSILHNGILMLAGGNTVVFNPHPKTKQISARVVRDLNRAMVEAGGPPDCLTTVLEPSIPTAQYLMTHPQVDMIAVTGGHRVVEFAAKTGKRVISGGPGNPPVIVDETADLDRAARCIIRGASLSHCTPCSSEKEIFVVASVADQLKELLKKYGAYELSADQGQALVSVIFKEIRPGRVQSVINMDYIGKPVAQILQRAIGLGVPAETKIALLETDANHPLIWTEQIMPVLPFVRCRDFEEAMTLGIAAEQGMRHTITFHSNSLANLARLSSRADASQLVKNGSSLAGLGAEGEGFKSLHVATGGEGLTRPRVFTRVRRCVLADDFRYRYGA